MNSRRFMGSPKLRRRHPNASTSTWIGAETGIKTIIAVHIQSRNWVKTALPTAFQHGSLL